VWEQVELTCPRDAVSFDDLASALGRQLRERGETHEGVETLFRVNLTGETHLVRELMDQENLRLLEERLRAEVGARWLEVRPRSLVRPVDVDSFRGTPTVLGEALALLERMREDDEALDRARPAHLAGREGGDVRAYLRSLLDGAEQEVASLLVPEDER